MVKNGMIIANTHLTKQWRFLVKNLFFFFVAFMLLAGCSVSNKEQKYAEMPEYVKTQPKILQQSNKNEGSLWKNSGALFSDLKASEVGDIVTIVVRESASSANKSGTKLSEESSTKSGLTNFMGAQNRIFKAFNAAAGPSGLVDMGGSSSYKGSGANTKSDTLSATIAARVVKVLPNHRFFIRGEKQIYTNGEEQTLIITGIIDKYKIDKNNTIDSSYISDAKIFYNGKGLVSDTRNKGWMQKLWEFVRPF